MKTIIADDEQLSCDDLLNLIEAFCTTLQIGEVCNKAIGFIK